MTERNPVRRLVLLILLATLSAAWAHRPGQSYIYLKVFGNRIEGRVELPLADLGKVLDLGLPVDGVTEKQLEPHADVLRSYVARHLEIKVDESSNPITLGEVTPWSATYLHYAVVNFRIDGLESRPKRLHVSYTGFLHELEDHGGMLVIEQDSMRGILENEKRSRSHF